MGDTSYEVPTRVVRERCEDLDALADLLQARGVTVRRPNGLVGQQAIVAPNVSTFMNASDAPRDAFLAYGDTVIETPPTTTKRLHEGHLYRDIFNDYFRRGANWVLAPRPTFAPGSLDLSFWADQQWEPLGDPRELSQALDIAFDAANVVRLGRDLIFNVGTANHHLGSVWLQRTLRSLGHPVRVHPVRLTDSHIDWQIMPLRPGVLLVHPEYLRRTYCLLPEPLHGGAS